MKYVHDYCSEMKHSILNLQSIRTVCGLDLSSTNYPGRTHLGSLCGPSMTASAPSIPRRETSCPYRVPHLTKRHIGNIIYLDDDVIVAVHVGQVLAGRHFLGHPGDVAFDYEDGRCEPDTQTTAMTHPTSNCPSCHRNSSHRRRSTPSNRERYRRRPHARTRPETHPETTTVAYLNKGSDRMSERMTSVLDSFKNPSEVAMHIGIHSLTVIASERTTGTCRNMYRRGG